MAERGSSSISGLWPGARRLRARLLGIGLTAAATWQAQAAAPKGPPPADRCLLIVETSKSMGRREDSTALSVRDLLMSSLRGQLRDGGTLGVWTFDDALHAGRFPLETWSTARREQTTQRVLAFLKNQPYSKAADFSKVAPALTRVVNDSQLLTVVLITSGDRGIAGTPFDAGVNKEFVHWHDQQQKARAPFVTIMRGRKGRLLTYVVNTPPWPLQVPQLAAETKSVEDVHEKLLQALYGQTNRTAPPLIISGKKSNAPPQAVENLPPSVLVSNPPPSGVAVASVKQTARTNEIGPSIRTNEIAQALPPPIANSKPTTGPTPEATQSSLTATNAKVETVSSSEAPASKSTESKQAQVLLTTASGVTSAPVAVAPGKLAVAAAAKPEPASAPTVVSQAPPSLASTRVVTQTSTSGPASAVVKPPKGPAPVSSDSASGLLGWLDVSKHIWIAAAVVVIFVFTITTIVRRRRRAVPLGSLITQVIDREKGQ